MPRLHVAASADLCEATLEEVPQKTNLLMALGSHHFEHGHTRCTPFVKCKDFLTDTMLSRELCTPIDIYNFVYDPGLDMYRGKETALFLTVGKQSYLGEAYPPVSKDGSADYYKLGHVSRAVADFLGCHDIPIRCNRIKSSCDEYAACYALIILDRQLGHNRYFVSFFMNLLRATYLYWEEIEEIQDPHDLLSFLTTAYTEDAVYDTSVEYNFLDILCKFEKAYRGCNGFANSLMGTLRGLFLIEHSTEVEPDAGDGKLEGLNFENTYMEIHDIHDNLGICSLLEELLDERKPTGLHTQAADWLVEYAEELSPAEFGNVAPDIRNMNPGLPGFLPMDNGPYLFDGGMEIPEEVVEEGEAWEDDESEEW